MLHAQFHKVGSTRRVHGGHDDVLYVVGAVIADAFALHHLLPVVPLAAAVLHKVVILHQAVVGDGRLEVLDRLRERVVLRVAAHDLAEEGGEVFATVEVDDAAHRPDEREEEDALWTRACEIGLS